MVLEFEVDLVALAEVSPYFLHYFRPKGVYLAVSKLPTIIELLYPECSDKSCQFYLTTVARGRKPFIFTLLNKLHIREIFLITTYFWVESVLEEIYIHCAEDKKVGHIFLNMYIDYLGSEHIFTHELFYKLKTSCWLPEKLESLSLENWIQTGKRTIARIIHNSNRSRKFDQRFVLEKCIACFREEKIFKNKFDSIFVMAPCCLHPVHKLCVNQFTIKR